MNYLKLIAEGFSWSCSFMMIWLVMHHRGDMMSNETVLLWGISFSIMVCGLWLKEKKKPTQFSQRLHRK